MMVMSAANCVWLDLRHSITKACRLPRPKHMTFSTVHLPSFSVSERMFFSFAQASLAFPLLLVSLMFLDHFLQGHVSQGVFQDRYVICPCSSSSTSTPCQRRASSRLRSICILFSNGRTSCLESAPAFPSEAFFFRFVWGIVGTVAGKECGRNRRSTLVDSCKVVRGSHCVVNQVRGYRFGLRKACCSLNWSTCWQNQTHKTCNDRFETQRP